VSATASTPAPTWPRLIGALLAGRDLDPAETTWAMREILAGAATDVQVAGFVVALRAKGETVDEVTGLVDGMLGAATRIDVPGPTLDVVGTGGDLANTHNISTMAAITAAGAGLRVVKHGNRSASSSSGTADVLETLGIRLDLTPGQVRQVALDVGITFCFARAFHPALRHVAVARSELGVPTVFNFLGPLTNPAQTNRCRRRGRRRPHRRDRRRGAGEARHPGAGVPRRRRAGRTHHHHDLDGARRR